jgi:hypothetical protein
MSGREYWGEWERDAGAMDVVASELVVTTAGSAEIPAFAPLAALLQRMHNAFGVDMAFVSEWCGEPVVRPHREADALHTVYGRRYLESSAPAGTPFRIDALPVIAADGSAHGALCCRVPLRETLETEIDGALRGAAGLIANWFAAACATA